MKNVETKGKWLIDSQKLLLSLFEDLVKSVLNNGNNKTVNEDNNVNNNDNDNGNDNDYDSDGDHDEQYYKIRQINKSFKTTDETKSSEDQIDIFKKLPCLND